MNITASLVKELRERSGAGMMECKKALVEHAGDIDAAMEYLRKSGAAKADKKAGRVAAEGRVVFAAEGSKAVLVEINSETDFVANDSNFIDFANKVANAAVGIDGDVEALKETSLGDDTVEVTRKALVGKIGENIQVRRLVRVNDGSNLTGYVHGGRIGVIVNLEGGDEDLARGIAMHIAAMNPRYVDASNVPADIVAKEKDIAMAQVADSGKPPEILEKMISGKVNKTLNEFCLTGQPFVIDTNLSVGQALKDAGAKVLGYERIEVGEGIEKAEDNFADEVMKQAGLA